MIRLLKDLAVLVGRVLITINKFCEDRVRISTVVGIVCPSGRRYGFAKESIREWIMLVKMDGSVEVVSTSSAPPRHHVV